ncbi:hypothetical protein [Francisella tularensis]|uniref:hypothetical protein n=1 Tax=Francisella tularensis TaxID=263 RepID=UPI0008F51023|nr:hypothetical protein [Francisella tularensis]APA83220.1 hypothetical protein N894_1236 [Francisella tularensis subsp. novicida PA10-7858]
MKYKLFFLFSVSVFLSGCWSETLSALNPLSQGGSKGDNQEGMVNTKLADSQIKVLTADEQGIFDKSTNTQNVKDNTGLIQGKGSKSATRDTGVALNKGDKQEISSNNGNNAVGNARVNSAEIIHQVEEYSDAKHRQTMYQALFVDLIQVVAVLGGLWIFGGKIPSRDERITTAMRVNKELNLPVDYLIKERFFSSSLKPYQIILMISIIGFMFLGGLNIYLYWA